MAAIAFATSAETAVGSGAYPIPDQPGLHVGRGEVRQEALAAFVSFASSP